MFAGQTHNLPFIDRYARAKKHWDTTKKPRAGAWRDSQRPLKDSRSWHYRLESDYPEQYIDVCLHQTVMARFYAPSPEGNESRLYMGHPSMTSRKFMRDVLGICHTAETTDGRKVSAPVYDVFFMLDKGDRFSAQFVYAPGNKLIVDRSRHTRHWRGVSSDEDKAARLAARRRWATYITLAQYRLHEFINNVTLAEDYGRPFDGRVIPYGVQHAVKNMDKDLHAGITPRQEDIDDFFVMCQRVFDTAASKRGYRQPGFQFQSWKIAAPHTYADLDRPLTEADVAKAVEAKVFDLLKLKTKKGAVEIPQFVDADTMPRSNVFAQEKD